MDQHLNRKVSTCHPNLQFQIHVSSSGNHNNIEIIFLCLFYQFQLFPCEGENILVAKQQSVMAFPKMCDIARPPLQSCSGQIICVAGKFLFCETTDAACEKILGTIIHINCSLICLQKGFMSEFFFQTACLPQLTNIVYPDLMSQLLSGLYHLTFLAWMSVQEILSLASIVRQMIEIYKLSQRQYFTRKVFYLLCSQIL